MREIALDQITGKDLIDYASLAQAFKQYLMDVLDYSEREANFVVLADFNNPYDSPLIMQDYEGNYIVDGKEYKIYKCHTNFCSVGLFHLANIKPFEFYMFFDLETLPNNTVGSHRSARKMYLI